MSEPEQPHSKSVPRSRIKAAAIAAGIVAASCGLAVGLDPDSPLSLGEGRVIPALAVSATIGVILFLMILFVLLLMEAGIEWRKRGGKPDPFTRDG